MKNLESLKTILLIVGTIIFNHIFWDEDLGINLLIFSMFLIGTTMAIHKSALASKPFLFSAAGVLITGFAVIYHNSSMAKFTHISSMLLMIGFANQNQLRSIIYALPTSIANYFRFPKTIFLSFQSLGLNTSPAKKIWRYTKLTLLPLVVLAIFYIIFQSANPVFKELSDDIWSTIDIWFTELFENISFLRISFLIWGLSIVGWVLYKSDIKYFINAESKLSDVITRIRKSRPKPESLFYTPYQRTSNPIALKNEYRSALIFIGLVNLLLLIVNIIDIKWIWFNFEYTHELNLSQFVHEGTYLLILSILLSIGIMLYFFRKNQNFFVHRKSLIMASGLWIAQNIILVVSVAIRNYHYINHYGLAYKRIGVIIFLALTVFGLVTLYLKINKKKSAFFLLKYNSWAVYAAFIFMSMINWDGIIIEHNITHNKRENMDVRFLLSLSDKTLPIIDQNKEIFQAKNWYYEQTDFEYEFKERIQELLDRKETTSWYSWNMLDDQAYKYFNCKN